MANMRWIKKLNRSFRGKTSTTGATLKKYSRDASIFEIKPQAVVFPKTAKDVEKLVNFVRTNKAELPFLSLTGRGAGTDMSGGAVNDSIIVDFNKHMHHMGKVTSDHVNTQPGVFYRNFEKKTLKCNLILPPYPSSRELCCVGGMVANNCGGEKTLNYGKAIDYVRKLRMVLADGKSYDFGPLTKEQLGHKLRQNDFEGEIYNRVYKLIEKNYAAIKKAKPPVTKNSTGYNIWDVWDKKTFDLTKLFVGSQGTLGLVTAIDFKLVPAKHYTSMLVVYMPALTPEFISLVLPTKPDSFEVFDDKTLKLAIRYFTSFRKIIGIWGTVKLGFQFIPDIRMFRRGMPKMVAIVEFEADTQAEADERVATLEKRVNLAKLDVLTERADTAGKDRRYWLIRRESFNLLRQHVKDKIAAPFIDDLVVPTNTLSEYIPKMEYILTHDGIIDTIAGHAGNGNFHIIPLMDLRDPRQRALIPVLLKKAAKLVKQYHGSLSGEHNDGLIRGPLIEEMYGHEMTKIFREVKDIFDPQDIFNPHKKMDATWDYTLAHIRRT